jgi:hypothetical protein
MKIFNEEIIVIPKAVVKLGLTTAFMLSVLQYARLYFQEKNMIKNDFFPLSSTIIKNEIGLSREVQDRSVKKLSKLNLIETKVMGIPATKHFKINLEQIWKLI